MRTKKRAVKKRIENPELHGSVDWKMAVLFPGYPAVSTAGRALMYSAMIFAVSSSLCASLLINS